MNKIIRLNNNLFEKVQRQYGKYQEMQRIEDHKNNRAFQELIERARNNPDLKPLADLYSKFDAPEDKRPRYKC